MLRTLCPLYSRCKLRLIVYTITLYVIVSHTECNVQCNCDRKDVFDEAQRLPLFGMLHDKETYVFKCTNSSTYACEELLDETKRVTDVRPFLWLLNLVARKNDKSELHRVSEIGALIGKRTFCATYYPLHSYCCLRSLDRNCHLNVQLFPARFPSPPFASTNV